MISLHPCETMTVHLSNNESGNELMQKVADAYADDAMLPNSVLEFGKTVTPKDSGRHSPPLKLLGQQETHGI